MDTYNEKLQKSEAAWKVYNDYLVEKEKYDAALLVYEAQLKLYEENFEQYLQDYVEQNGANDEAYQEYLAAKAEYEQALALYNAFVTENTIFTDVTEYNKDITTENERVDARNEALNNDVDGNANDISGVGSANQKIQIGQDVLDVLNGYEDLVKEQAELEKMGAALEAHKGKDSENLASQEYADYLAAVEAYNAAVETINSKIDAYNKAVTAYNDAVDKYNETQKESSSTSTGEMESTGTADWGNFAKKNLSFNHIDVRYQAAAVKDKTVNADGEVSYSDSVSKYDIEGVYYNKEAAESNPNSFGVIYTNTLGKEVEYKMVKDDAHNEFSTASTDRHGNIDRTDASANKNTVVTFYAVLDDGQGIAVRLDANSVYAENSYYKYDKSDRLNEFKDSSGQALKIVTIDGEKYYDVSGQSVFLISALACDGYTFRMGGLDLILNMETIIQIYQADKAQTVSYLGFEKGKTAQIEAPNPVTAPDALDVGMLEPEEPEAPPIVEEPETFTEIEPKLELPDAPDPVENPGEFEGIEPELKLPDAPDPVENPGEFEGIEPELKLPDAPDPVENPGEFEGIEPKLELPDAPDPVENPGEFTEKEPEAPVPTERLEHVDPLEKLNEKLVILFDDPTEYEPVMLNDDFEIDFDFDFEIEIPDEEVPLAAAPKTGDISSLWGILSGLSAAGMFLLGRKRKDEE